MSARARGDRRSVYRLGEFVGFLRDPLTALSDCRDRWGDVAVLPVPGPRLVQFTAPRDVSVLLKMRHRDRLATRSLSDLLGTGLITNNGDDLTWRRRLVGRSLSKQVIQLYIEDMQHQTRTWAHAVCADEPGRAAPLEITTQLFSLSLDILIQTLFGSQIHLDKRRFADYLDTYMFEFYLDNTGRRSLLPASVSTPGRRRRRNAVAGMRAIVAQSIRLRRAAGTGNDLLYLLLQAVDDDGHALDDNKLLDELLTMLIPGHETPALMLGYALWLLANHPQVQTCLHTELSTSEYADPGTAHKSPYLAAVVDECFRLYPPAYVVGREACEDMRIGNFDVRAGDQLVAPQWVVHRDPRWWREPLAFRPERWLNGETSDLVPGTYFPFGGGQRSCLGGHFSRLMGQVVLAEIVKHIEIAPDPDYKLNFIQGPTLRPREGIRVRMARRTANTALCAA